MALKCKPVFSAKPEDQKAFNRRMITENCKTILAGQDRLPEPEGFVDDDVRRVFAADSKRGFKGKTTADMHYDKVMNQSRFDIRRR